MKGVGKMLKKAVAKRKLSSSNPGHRNSSSSSSSSNGNGNGNSNNSISNMASKTSKVTVDDNDSASPMQESAEWTEWSDHEDGNLQSNGHNAKKDDSSIHARTGNEDDQHHKIKPVRSLDENDDGDDDDGQPQPISSPSRKRGKMFKKLLSFRSSNKKEDVPTPASITIAPPQATLEQTLGVNPSAINDPSSSHPEEHPVVVSSAASQTMQASPTAGSVVSDAADTQTESIAASSNHTTNTTATTNNTTTNNNNKPKPKKKGKKKKKAKSTTSVEPLDDDDATSSTVKKKKKKKKQLKKSETDISAIDEDRRKTKRRIKSVSKSNSMHEFQTATKPKRRSTAPRKPKSEQDISLAIHSSDDESPRRRRRSRDKTSRRNNHSVEPRGRSDTLHSKYGAFVARSRSRSIEREDETHDKAMHIPRRSKKPGSSESSVCSIGRVETVSADEDECDDDDGNNDHVVVRIENAPDAMDQPQSMAEAIHEVDAVSVSEPTRIPAPTPPIAPQTAPSTAPSTATATTTTAPTTVAEQSITNNRLQEQLSEALEKVVRSTEETMAVKDNLLTTTQSLTKAQTEILQLTNDRNEWKTKADDVQSNLRHRDSKIAELNLTIDDQLDNLERTDRKLELADEEIRELEDELRKLEDELVDLKLHATAHDTAHQRIASLEREVEDQRAEIQRLKAVQLENTMLQGQLKGRDLEWTVKLNKKDEAIAILQKEAARLVKELDDREKGSFVSLTKQLHDKQSQIASTQEQLEHAQTKIEQLTEHNHDLQSNNDGLEDQVRAQMAKTQEWQDKNAALQDKLTGWTEKTYTWKQRAEAAEQKLANINPISDDDDESTASNAPQALFLQAAMDRTSVSSDRRKSFLGFGWGEAEDSTDTASLQAQIAKLQSELIKAQSGYKEDMYLKEKRIQELEDENCDYAAKNAQLIKQTLAVD